MKVMLFRLENFKNDLKTLLYMQIGTIRLFQRLNLDQVTDHALTPLIGHSIYLTLPENRVFSSLLRIFSIFFIITNLSYFGFE